jgi:hypothetical protein
MLQPHSPFLPRSQIFTNHFLHRIENNMIGSITDSMYVLDMHSAHMRSFSVMYATYDLPALHSQLVHGFLSQD